MYAALQPKPDLSVSSSELPGDLSMYPNQDAIFERLETTKKFGLLSDYLVAIPK